MKEVNYLLEPTVVHTRRLVSSFASLLSLFTLPSTSDNVLEILSTCIRVYLYTCILTYLHTRILENLTTCEFPTSLLPTIGGYELSTSCCNQLRPLAS